MHQCILTKEIKIIKTQNKKQQKTLTKYSILYSKPSHSLVMQTSSKLQRCSLFPLSVGHRSIDPPTINPTTTSQPNTLTHQPLTHRPHTHQPSDPRFIDLLARSYFKDLIIKKIFILQNTNTAEKMQNYTSVYLNLCLYN